MDSLVFKKNTSRAYLSAALLKEAVDSVQRKGYLPGVGENKKKEKYGGKWQQLKYLKKYKLNT